MRRSVLAWSACVGIPALSCLIWCGCRPADEGDGGALPAFLPRALSIDVSELPDDEDGSTDVRQLSGGTVAYERTLRASAYVVHGFQKLADQALALGEMIQADITDPASAQVGGVIVVDGQDITYKADFSAFDFDGDGTADGSGSATVEPVAVRIWVDRGAGFERFLCALVTVRPTEENLGAGTMVIRPGAVSDEAFEDFQLRVVWDRTEPSHGWNEAFVSGQFRSSVVMAIGRQRVDVRTENESTEKTVRSSSVFADNPWGFEQFASSVHFERGSGSALLSANSIGGAIQLDVAEDCVSIAERDLTDASACAELNVADVGFLVMPVGGEADFPAGFGESPSF